MKEKRKFYYFFRFLHQASMKGSERVMREKRLYEASLSGSVESFNKLMQEDGLTLARVSVTSFNETPLHVAAMLGHVKFAKALLSHKQDLASELDSQGQSPLHLASANGYVEMVKVLLMADPHVCLVCDADGRTPLHLAVMKGRVNVITELVRVRPEVTHYRLDRGETVLHLCVVYNRLEALKVLVEAMSRIEDGVNVTDDDGNTILHIATTLKQVETIKYLLRRTGVKVNALNENGITALDIVEHMPRDLKAMEIRELVMEARGVKAKNIPAMARVTHRAWGEDEWSVISPAVAPAPLAATPATPTVNTMLNPLKQQDNWLKNKGESLLVVATVIAAMAYQAGLSPPGGVWQDDKPDPTDRKKFEHVAGTSVMADKNPGEYLLFWIANTVSFVSSLSIMLLLVSGLPLKKRIFKWILTAAVWVTITSMASTYVYSMAAIAPDKEWAKISAVIRALILVWYGLIGIIFLGHTCRFIIWIIRKVRKCRRKNKRNTNEQAPQGQGQA